MKHNFQLQPNGLSKTSSSAETLFNRQDKTTNSTITSKQFPGIQGRCCIYRIITGIRNTMLAYFTQTQV